MDYRSRPTAVALAMAIAIPLSLSTLTRGDATKSGKVDGKEVERLDTEKMLNDYYRRMTLPKPMLVREGSEWESRRRVLRERILQEVALWPLPQRVDLDVHQSESLDHPWCTVRRVYYRLWPGVYSSGLLFLPKKPAASPLPAMLCPHGHWTDGNAHAEVQKRCLNFARLGYVTFSSCQNHYEDLYLGVSHQTLMIWSNLRALDYIESLPGVQRSRIGVAGASGGGLQTQMVVALDNRVRAATVVGLTCDFREIMFPDAHHCVCNHFPRVMQWTDHPEISALGMPLAIQYLTMNDWTKNFRRDNLPSIRRLYAVNGYAERVDCMYYDTPHSYDKPKRERTYWWMERWVRGNEKAKPGEFLEPDLVKTFPVERLKGLTVDVPDDRGFRHISRIYAEQRGYKVPVIDSPDEWHRYRTKMRRSLRYLLGTKATLPREDEAPKQLRCGVEDELRIERVAYPSEGGIFVPTVVIRRKGDLGKLPVCLVLSELSRESLLSTTGPDSPRQLARDGNLVLLPEVRCHGRMLSTGTKNAERQWQAWQRNGVVWGRPVAAMACTDIRAVLDGLAVRDDAEMAHVSVISHKSGSLAIAALFAGALDSRVGAADLDFAGHCFKRRDLPLVSAVLQYGDVPQWAALMANRKLTLRHVPEEAGDPAWLHNVFRIAGNGAGLKILP